MPEEIDLTIPVKCTRCPWAGVLNQTICTADGSAVCPLCVSAVERETFDTPVIVETKSS